MATKVSTSVVPLRSQSNRQEQSLSEDNKKSQKSDFISTTAAAAGVCRHCHMVPHGRTTEDVLYCCAALLRSRICCKISKQQERRLQQQQQRRPPPPPPPQLGSTVKQLSPVLNSSPPVSGPFPNCATVLVKLFSSPNVVLRLVFLLVFVCLFLCGIDSHFCCC